MPLCGESALSDIASGPRECLRPWKTSVDPFGVGAHSKLRALGFTGAVKHGAPGARLSHMPCHNLMPFSRRKFWKSDSFRWCIIGANKYTNNCVEENDRCILDCWKIHVVTATYGYCWHWEQILIHWLGFRLSCLGQTKFIPIFIISTLLGGIKKNPLHRIKQFGLYWPNGLHILHATCRLIDWLIDWLIYLLIYWLMDRLIDWLLD